MKKRVLYCIFIIILLPLLLYGTVKFIDLIHYKCPYLELFNIYCGGCGATRMIKKLFELEFYQAFRYNPLLFIILILCVPYIIYSILLYIKKGTIKVPNIIIIIIIFILIVIFGVLRNLPDFYYLRPTKII